MHIDPSQLLAPALTQRSTADAAWRVGDLLSARVIGPVTQNSSGETLLRIGRQLVNAHSRVPLTPGDTLSLRVTRLQPQPLLRVEQLPPPAPTVSRALAQTLPRQLDTPQFARLFRTLVTIASANAGATPIVTSPVRATTPAAPGLPTDVVTAARSVLRSVPAAADVLAPRALAGALNSIARGHIEHATAAATRGAAPPLTAAGRVDAVAASIRYDAAIARLADVLHAQPSSATPSRGNVVTSDQTRDPVPSPATTEPAQRRVQRPQAAAAVAAPRTYPLQPAATAGINGDTTPDIKVVIDLVDGALARLRGQQLLALHHQPANPLPLAVDLPVALRERVDLWHFEFEQPRAEPAGVDDGIGVRLLLQLDADRTVEAAISLTGGNIRVTLDSSSDGLREALRVNLDTLAQQLHRQGLSPGALQVAQLPPAPAAGPRPPLVQARA